MILDEIVAQKKIQLKKDMSRITIEGWKQKIKRPGIHKPLDFYGALKNNGDISIIAEVKKASPSKGIIKEDFDPLKIAKEYVESDIQAISVLTERNFFKGDEDYLVKIRQFCPLPILRKDFIIDLWQIYESRYIGADAILLIVSLLSDEELKKFQIVANILGMQCLVEVHDERELERALESGARIIGINNRDLRTFEVDLKNTEKLMNRIPNDRVVVSESGIKDTEDLKYLKELGVDAVLIGETFMRARSISEKIREFKAV
ncbi:MAG TPA: indole-3-glycerol phosphate synthase TrpC [Hungateiclostridium thermocellum]|jgi:indole-3-glycerol phosphate synthase|uniref:Indole-3-glycerol phosphate synthase n=2 Tax=Acetivibrio thermocellus TaxID=1515 RepID=TRPC_ACET2|nr:indole-3-glycerol phosphate synthase TrpC [Acetivibrio thermocellus]A3DDS7.1 RecName: Full=Indole-3-glycerol phosphate synthase; Short=IGPS [Acetivibrio thermocellus ATCC 27405]CDG35565.1 Indole-3-glycerol phosphate synthase [Acetivibrio thermocellus BC1]ABN52106.1 Indole-3-glycerol-phosphate synthase [Acetivibrio thermocellus ATCC 27405]ADU74410.1 Indole-3-glycerol-phosphate synthase [Acetivibrio thermocellus DSM 1313]ALX08353.1 Indole-3-glycerol phosphate synthase [Acetivibrio thermocellu